MSRDLIAKLLAFAEQQPHRGMWLQFCHENGTTRHAVFHWRRKLGLPMRRRIARQEVESDGTVSKI